VRMSSRPQQQPQYKEEAKISDEYSFVELCCIKMRGGFHSLLIIPSRMHCLWTPLDVHSTLVPFDLLLPCFLRDSGTECVYGGDPPSNSSTIFW